MRAEFINVSALNAYVKTLLEHDAVISDICVLGELSNFVRNSKSGHCYFSLKDESASVKGVMFASYASKLAFEPQNGTAVIVRCRASLYERDGAYQLYVYSMQPYGEGAKQLALKELISKLAKEGIFDESHKKPLPRFPHAIGLITSKNGAAARDVIKVVNRRWPCCTIKLFPVAVQGDAVEHDVVNALSAADSAECDVIIVTRGGGSEEDLWQFNSEAVARAVYACNTPVVSAVGHEVDTTVIDYVSDMRAPTPSAAGEVATPDIADVKYSLISFSRRIFSSFSRRVEICKLSLERLTSSGVLKNPLPITEQRMFLLCETEKRLVNTLSSKIDGLSVNLTRQSDRIELRSPAAVMKRGFALVQKDGIRISSASSLSGGDNILISFSDGDIAGKVEKIYGKDL